MLGKTHQLVPVTDQFPHLFTSIPGSLVVDPAIGNNEALPLTSQQEAAMDNCNTFVLQTLRSKWLPLKMQAVNFSHSLQGAF